MSPEFILRPSLSGAACVRLGLAPGPVSPEFILRPSLSVAGQHPTYGGGRGRVAGVYTPAFVERSSFAPTPSPAARRVAGVYTPAFVERPRIGPATTADHGVSPEFILRPSLSVSG